MRKDDRVTWWKEGFRVALSLPGITISYEALKADLKKRGNLLWDVDGVRWKLTDQDAHENGDEIMEQLWAVKVGLA